MKAYLLWVLQTVWCVRLAYFAPLIAGKVCYRKGGNYMLHIFALHRLTRFKSRQILCKTNKLR